VGASIGRKGFPGDGILGAAAAARNLELSSSSVRSIILAEGDSLVAEEADAAAEAVGEAAVVTGFCSWATGNVATVCVTLTALAGMVTKVWPDEALMRPGGYCRRSGVPVVMVEVRGMEPTVRWTRVVSSSVFTLGVVMHPVAWNEFIADVH